ncbi:FAD-dependent oxidoreductase [Actinophytocola sp.]|uniref:FAD-dependent oxidoreductase n=1 Tax=Actinophytocola sp. TaxID=1872138 RepID=UPI002D802CF8|nr:FAD-dependent monooxygenase [Actinophytocola sp.]HET9139876.1 FAD-dependent monooxygenase [Actinophytocola sp.]
MGRDKRNHAVVLGASMAGLLAARVLAEEFDRVTLIDRDTMPPDARHRRGVPQSRHAHGLLARGQQILEELFPGLTEELVQAGAPAGDLLGDVRWHLNGNRLRQRASGLTALCASRPLLENRVRDRVLDRAGVTVLDRHDIVGLATTSDAARVTGVRVIGRADGGSAEVVEADLVVDATGAGSRLPVWLTQLGYPAPEEETVRVDVGYATRNYRLRPGALGEDLVVVLGPTRDNLRGAVLETLEDRTMLTLVGRLGDYPPTDPDGFTGFVATLPAPDVAEAIRDAEPLDAPVPTRFPASVRRRYERLRRFPAGLLVTGDAVCRFNPTFAQGMTVAALDALALRRELEHGGAPRPDRFFAGIATGIDAAWAVAVGADLALPGVIGRRTPRTRVMSRYVARLQAAAARDAGLAEAFIRVAGLVDRPPRLLRPAIAARVLAPGGPTRPAARISEMMNG